MIAFLYNDWTSALWLALLAIAGGVTLAGPQKPARRILVCLVANWLVTRALVTAGLADSLLWPVNDVLTAAALLLYGRTLWSSACAAMYLLVVASDNALYFGLSGFPGVATVSDVFGYVTLLLMMGAAHVDMDRHSPRGHRLPPYDRNHAYGPVRAKGIHAYRYGAPDDPGMGGSQ